MQNGVVVSSASYMPKEVCASCSPHRGKKNEMFMLAWCKFYNEPSICYFGCAILKFYLLNGAEQNEKQCLVQYPHLMSSL